MIEADYRAGLRKLYEEETGEAAVTGPSQFADEYVRWLEDRISNLQGQDEDAA
jgi:hypothetical protein